MNHDQLQQALTRLRDMAADHPDMDATTRAELTTLEADISRQLGDSIPDADDNPLLERTQELSATLEASHPQVNAVLTQIVTILGQIGV